jgi:hypothetical protein
VAANAIQIGLGLDDLPGWIDEVSVIPGITLLVLGGGLIVAGRRSPANQVTLLAAISPVLFLSLHLGVLPAMARIYGVDSTAALIARVQAQGRSVAYLGKYHGQFQFVGRLERPLDVVSYPDLDGWLATHPDGYVVAVLKDPGPDARDAAAHVAPYRSRVLTVWAVHDAIAHRDLFR